MAVGKTSRVAWRGAAHMGIGAVLHGRMALWLRLRRTQGISAAQADPHVLANRIDDTLHTLGGLLLRLRNDRRFLLRIRRQQIPGNHAQWRSVFGWLPGHRTINVGVLALKLLEVVRQRATDQLYILDAFLSLLLGERHQVGLLHLHNCIRIRMRRCVG